MTHHHLAARVRRCSSLALLMLLLAAPVSAQSSLSDLNIEELMKLDAGQVFGASERLQAVTEAPASVSFVTAEDIRRHGYRTLADILRGVRGLYVTDDRNFSLIGARGFGKPGDYNSRILLLVNGHRVNDNVFGQAQIGAEFGLDPAMFERVEIIRGPASSLYGDSAFFAVINVITKTGASLGGGSLTIDGGTLGTRLVRASGGHRFTNGADLAVSTTFEHSDGNKRLFFPEFNSPETNNGVAENLDAEGVRQVYGRFAFKNVTFTGAYGTRNRKVPTASFNTVFNEQHFREQTTDRHTLLDAQYGLALGGGKLSLRGSFDQLTYDGYYPVFGVDEARPVVVGHNVVLGRRWSAGGRYTRALPWRQTLTAGAEVIDNLNQDQESGVVDAPPELVSLGFTSDRASVQYAGYVQDEIKIGDSVIINAGLRYDDYEQFTKVTPRTALIVMPSGAQSFKYLFGSAFRAPNAYERTTFYFGESVERLRPESIDTHEFVWERYTNDALRTSVSAYWYKADRLITLVPDPSGFFEATFVNQGKVHAAGLELEAQLRMRRGAQAHFSYALQRTEDQETRRELPNSPRHMLKGRFTLPLWTEGASLGVEGLYTSRRETFSGQHLSGAALFNVTAIQPLGKSWELTGTIRNLFDVDYADPGSTAHRQDSIPQNGVTARVGLVWKFWKPR